MSNFYSNWIKRNKEENKRLLRQLQGGGDNGDDINANPDIGPNSSLPSAPKSPTDIVYTHGEFQLVVEQKYHKRQKNFKLQDALFVIKVIPLGDEKNPLLSDLLEFLKGGFENVLLQMKKFFQPTEHRIAYLTLYQEPMESFFIFVDFKQLTYLTTLSNLLYSMEL